MKNKITTLAIAALMAAGLGSCKKDDTKPAYSTQTSTSTSSDPMMQGKWTVASFQVNGVDHADAYSMYSLTFGPNGVVTAGGQGKEVKGKWSMVPVDGHNSLQLDFGTTDPFNLLNNKDWKVISSTATYLQLEGSRGDDGKETLELKKM